MRIALFAVLVLWSADHLRGAVESVEVNREKVTVRGTIAKAGPVEELFAHQTDEQVGARHQVKPDADGRFVLAVARRDGEGRDRILSRWRLVGDKPQYPTELGGAAVYPKLVPMEAKNRKGLGGIHMAPQLFPDLVDLGVGHITVNILLRPKFSAAQLKRLDQTLAFAHKNGIVVTAILLVPPRGSVLTHPNCDPGAKYSMPDVTSSGGVAAFSKCLAFLAERYTKPDAPHGRISHWIIGNEVDAGWVWTNAGEKTASEYMEQYHRALRIAHITLRGYDPHAKVYISLTHHWESPHRNNPRRFYRPRDLLIGLAKLSRAGGDFEWGVAYHPYAQSLFEPKTWNDQRVTDEANDSPLITMKNIEVLDQFMHAPEMRFRKKKVRTVLLSEQGYHAPPGNPQAELLQAAAVAYAWRQMKPLRSIEAFHYHRWIDHEREGGLQLGLWSVKKGSITWPDKKKRAWEVYRALGTAEEAAATAFANPILPAANLESKNLVAWCIVPFDAKKRGPAGRAAMLKKLGIGRCAYDWRAQHVEEFEQEIIEYQKHGIEFFAFWAGHEKAFELFEKYKLSPQIWRTAPSPKSGSQQDKIRAAADGLEPHVARIKKFGSELGLYNHGGWGGRPENLVAVCNELRRRGHQNVGIVYNWHHGHGEIERWPQVLELLQPYLLCLNLNGMNDGAQPKILTLGEGEHDAQMLNVLRASGYRDPVGIIDHRSDLDSEPVLRANLSGLESLTK